MTVLFVLGAAAAIAAIGIAIKSRGDGGWTSSDNIIGIGSGMCVGILTVVAVALIAVSFARTVPVGNCGISTLFGAVQEDRTYSAGFHYGVNPFVKMYNMDFRKQKVAFPISAFTADLQEADMSVAVTYAIDASKAMTLFKNVGPDYEEILIGPAVNDTAKGATAQYQAVDLVKDRGGLRDAIHNGLRDRLSGNQIIVYDFAIENIDFTDAFTDAVEAKVTAEQELLKAQTEAETKRVNAQGEADVKRTEADAAAYEVKVMAEAQAEANKKLAESITPTLVEYKAVEQWDGKVPVVSGNGQSIIDARSLIGDVSSD